MLLAQFEESLNQWLIDECRKRTRQNEADADILYDKVDAKVDRAWESFQKIDDEKQRKSWLYRVMVNTHKDLIRGGDFSTGKPGNIDEPLPNTNGMLTLADVIPAADTETGSDEPLIRILLQEVDWWEFWEFEDDFDKILAAITATLRHKKICVACIPHFLAGPPPTQTQVAKDFNVSSATVTNVLNRMRVQFTEVLSAKPGDYPWITKLKALWVGEPFRFLLTPRMEWMLECLGYNLKLDEAVFAAVHTLRRREKERLSSEEVSVFSTYLLTQKSEDEIVEKHFLGGRKQELAVIVKKGCESLWGYTDRNRGTALYSLVYSHPQRKKEGATSLLLKLIKQARSNAPTPLNAALSAAFEGVQEEWKRTPPIDPKCMQAFLDAYFACYTTRLLGGADCFATVGAQVCVELHRSNREIVDRLHKQERDGTVTLAEAFVLSLSC